MTNNYDEAMALIRLSNEHGHYQVVRRFCAPVTHQEQMPSIQRSLLVSRTSTLPPSLHPHQHHPQMNRAHILRTRHGFKFSVKVGHVETITKTHRVAAQDDAEGAAAHNFNAAAVSHGDVAIFGVETSPQRIP